MALDASLTRTLLVRNSNAAVLHASQSNCLAGQFHKLRLHGKRLLLNPASSTRLFNPRPLPIFLAAVRQPDAITPKLASPVASALGSPPGTAKAPKGSSQARDVSVFVGLAPRSISVTPDAPPSPQQPSRSLRPNSRDGSSQRPVVSCQRLAENAERLHDILRKLSLAKSLEEKDQILNTDRRVRAAFPLPDDSPSAKFVKPAISLAMASCNREEIILLKCLVASGQEHLLETPVAWRGFEDAFESGRTGLLSSSGLREHGQQERSDHAVFGRWGTVANSGGSNGVKQAFSMLATMIDGWESPSNQSSSRSLPSFMEGFDNPGVFPTPIMDWMDWEDRLSSNDSSSSSSSSRPGSDWDSESFFSSVMQGLERPSVFPAPFLDLVDWENRGDSAAGNSSSSSSDESDCCEVAAAGGAGKAQAHEQLESLLSVLRRVEKFYDGIGGIIGYQATCLDLIRETNAAAAEAAARSDSAPSQGGAHGHLVDTAGTGAAGTGAAAGRSERRFTVPEGPDLAADPEFANQAAYWGLEGLPSMGEIYPLGGAGDRLGLVDDVTGECLPVAMLPYCGRTLLEGLIRDLEAREYLHFRLFGRRHVTPVAIMTSAAKRNHSRVLEVLRDNQWFGRGEENFKLFEQPLVPTVAASDGSWLASGALTPVLKPGGHGVIWKLAADEGVFEWFRRHNRKAAIIRQISNPLSATDTTLLALSGIGLHENKRFGFASCHRSVGTAEGVNVLTEHRQADGGWSYGVTCVEYTEFQKLGIEDVPVALGSSKAQYPANTNVLFADLQSVEEAVMQQTQAACCSDAAAAAAGAGSVLHGHASTAAIDGGAMCMGLRESQNGVGGVVDGSNASSSSSSSSSSICLSSPRHPPSLPGMIMNLNKSVAFTDENGQKQSIPGGRLECTMQNIADHLLTTLPHRLANSSGDAAAASCCSSSASTHSTDQAVNGQARPMEDRERSASSSSSSSTTSPPLSTFLVFNDRRKVTSSAKRRRKPTDTSLHQTPDGSFLDLNRNSLELFASCGVEMPEMNSDHRVYVDTSPPFIFLFHPALGPLWSVIRQKVRGGSVSPGSEVKLEVAEILWRDVHVSGSLLVEADTVMGSRDSSSTGAVQFGGKCARCRLENVHVSNAGVHWSSPSNVYWRHSVERHEALKVVLRGDAEFEARDVTITGDRLFEVPSGYRMLVTTAPGSGEPQVCLEKLPGSLPSWAWNYSVGGKGQLQLSVVES